jgi:glyoxylase-like metal-dependent hydrolase (beta-lactamase superfamily II)
MINMNSIQKVAEDLYLIEQPVRPGWFVGVVIVLGSESIGLVDTGFERTPKEYIFPALKNLEHKPEEITFVVNTHRDGDHILGNKVIKDATKAKIAVHELEAEAIETSDVNLKNEESVKLGNRDFKVVYTPGHRPGSICLYDQKNYTLITGDSVCGDRTDLIRMDKNIYIRSLKQLLDLNIEILVMSHPFKPLGKSVLNRKESKEMIQASIDIAKKLK